MFVETENTRFALLPSVQYEERDDMDEYVRWEIMESWQRPFQCLATIKMALKILSHFLFFVGFSYSIGARSIFLRNTNRGPTTFGSDSLEHAGRPKKKEWRGIPRSVGSEVAGNTTPASGIVSND